MLVKICKNALLVSAAVVLLTAAAFAAPSALTGGGSSGADSSLVREIKDGITVQYKETVISQRYPEYLEVTYTVTSDKDQVIKVACAEAILFDSLGSQLNPEKDPLIGNHRTQSREIIEGVQTPVAVYYKVGKGYAVHERYARVAFVVNGEKIFFRDFPSKP